MAHAPTLDPWSYQSWVRSLQRKLLATDERAELAKELLRAYGEAADQIALRPADWHMYLSLATRRALREEAGSADALQELVELHQKSVQDSLDMSLFVRCASFFLHLHAARAQSAAELPEDSTRVTDVDGAVWDVRGLIETWTGLSDTPALHANGTYAATSSLAPLVPSDDADELLSDDAVRDALRSLYAQCAYHTTQSAALWDLYLDWELRLLTQAERTPERLDLVQQVFLARLQVPHESLEDTFQRFSSFVSTYYPAEDYEETLASANKHYADALRMWRERERHEASIAAPGAALEHWTPYLSWESHRLKTLRTAKDKTHLATEEELGAALYRRALHRFGWYPLGKDAEEQVHAARPPTQAEEKAWMAKSGRKSHKMLEKEKHAARVEARALCTAPESLWLDYAALAGHAQPDATSMLDLCRAATRALPTSGRLWALYLRTLVRYQRPKAQFDEVFSDVLHSRTLADSGGGAALVAFLQARVDGERAYATLEAAVAQHVAPEDVVLYADLDRFMHIYELLVHALGEAAKLPRSEQDQSFALERYAVDWVERAARALSAAAGAEAAAGLYPLAESVWENALKAHASSVQAHLYAAQYYAQHDNDARARQLFRAGAAKHGDESKMPLLEAWVQFEHARGTIAQIEHAEGKAKAESDRLWKAWYRSMYQHESAGASAQAGEGTAPDDGATADVPMAEREAPGVAAHTEDAAAASANAPAAAPKDAASSDVPPRDAAAGAAAGAAESQKRKADDLPAAEPKKGRTDAPQPARDREFSSIMVSGLPHDATEAELRHFFRECGEIYEVAGPRGVAETTPEGERTAAALVEFTERDMVAAARTRDLKRIRGFEVHIAPSYQCTLYVTNFAPDTDDAQIRARFGQYGALFDVRWPSRKFAQSRRFCYVQFVRADYAHAALAEHGVHWSEEFALQVFLSNPAHKKQRTDAHANERELYMTGLPRGAHEEQVRAFFEPHAPVEGVRLPLRPDGKSRGIAFISFHSAIDARRAMQATNSTQFLGRLVAVMLADAGRRAPARPESAEDRHARSVVVAGLPPDAQEALIQQAVEKALGPGTVKRVFWTPGRHDADAQADSLVELQDAETAGRAVLGASVEYDGRPLVLRAHTPAPKEALVPRAAARARRGRGGALGFARVHEPRAEPRADAPDRGAPKGQDQFRAMLYK